MKKIRVLIAILGLDQHELGALAISKFLRDAGFEVVYAGRFNLPPKIVKMAVEEDVDVIGISCHSWEYLYFLPEMIQLLKAGNLSIPLVLGGSVITAKDEISLREKGVAAAFGPTASTEEMIRVLQRLAQGGESAGISGN
jgi:methylmalonyl-CoA mutase C-terminal domain/subunit